MTKTKPLPSVERLQELLTYDPETGNLAWAVQRSNRIPAGTKAGTLHPSGYVHVFVDSRGYKAHRLAWLMATGEDPGCMEIDHINGDKSDNRLANLRICTRSQNQANRRRSSRVSHKGITQFRGRWMAQIRLNQSKRYLGLYDTPEAAHLAYVAAANELHGEFARAA